MNTNVVEFPGHPVPTQGGWGDMRRVEDAEVFDKSM